MTKQSQVKVRLSRAGVKSCGQYQAGKEYSVDKKEATRLIKAKGFVEVGNDTHAALVAEIDSD